MYKHKNIGTDYQASHATKVKTDRIIESEKNGKLLDYFVYQIDFITYSLNSGRVLPEYTARALRTIKHFETRIQELCI